MEEGRGPSGRRRWAGWLLLAAVVLGLGALPALAGLLGSWWIYVGLVIVLWLAVVAGAAAAAYRSRRPAGYLGAAAVIAGASAVVLPGVVTGDPMLLGAEITIAFVAVAVIGVVCIVVTNLAGPQ